MKLPIALHTRFAQAVYMPDSDGTQVQFDPLDPQGFELRSESGILLWGEAWGGGGQCMSVSQPARVCITIIGGQPYLDVHVQFADGERRELRIPAIDVIMIAPRADSDVAMEHLVDLRRARTVH